MEELTAIHSVLENLNVPGRPTVLLENIITPRLPRLLSPIVPFESIGPIVPSESIELLLLVSQDYDWGDDAAPGSTVPSESIVASESIDAVSTPANSASVVPDLSCLGPQAPALILCVFFVNGFSKLCIRYVL